MAFDGGTGTALDPYLVSTPAQLNDVRNYLTSFFLQTADIDLSGYANWEPIGRFVNLYYLSDDSGIYMFSGAYDGQSFTISGLTIDDQTRQGIGLFGIAKSATFQNITLINVNIKSTCLTISASPYKESGRYVGALIGSMMDGTIHNCSSTGTIDGYGGQYFGGLIGTLEQIDTTKAVVASNSWSSVTIRSFYNALYPSTSGLSPCGGFVSYTEGDDTNPLDLARTNCVRLTDCYATGSLLYMHSAEDVNATNEVSELGGFVGSMWSSIFERCYATGDIYGSNQLGGFVGIGSDYIVKDCYSTGDVLFAYDYMALSGLNEDDFYEIAGFGANVSQTSGNCGFINCYSAGSVSVGDFYGTAGFQPDPGVAVINCFYDSTVCLLADADALGKNTTEMKKRETFTGWNFHTIWTIHPDYNNGYPVFAYQVPFMTYFYHKHFIKQDGRWVEMGDVERFASTEIADFTETVNTLLDTALTAALEGAY